MNLLTVVIVQLIIGYFYLKYPTNKEGINHVCFNDKDIVSVQSCWTLVPLSRMFPLLMPHMTLSVSSQYLTSYVGLNLKGVSFPDKHAKFILVCGKSYEITCFDLKQIINQTKPYNLFTNNCVHFVNNVIKKAKQRRNF